MTRRRRSVRAKLTALVATPIVMMVVALPVLYWLLHRQLVEDIHLRVQEAAAAFEQELKDDLADLTLASRVITADADTRRFILARDAKRAGELAEVFHNVFPNLAVLLAAADGEIVAQVGCAQPLRRLQDVPSLMGPLRGEPFRGLTEHGSEGAPAAPAAYTMALPVREGGALVGAVVVCLPIDAAHLANARAKLGFELGVVGPGDALLDRTAGFPRVDVAGLGHRASVVDAGGRAFAMSLFAPAELHPATGASRRVVAALDVSDVRRAVRFHLLYALGALGLCTLLAVAFGARLARVMLGRHRQRVSEAMKRLQRSGVRARRGREDGRR